MRVRAMKTGYHKVLRVPGTKDAEFDVPDDFPLGSWMEKVGDSPSLFPALEGAGPGAAPDELTDLRAAWQKLTSKNAPSGWSIDKLKKRIAALGKTN